MLNFFILQPKAIHEKLEKPDFFETTHLFFPLSRTVITSLIEWVLSAQLTLWFPILFEKWGGNIETFRP